MEILSETIAQYDIVAIQEIRDKTGTAISALVAQIDNLGTDYTISISPRLGRTTSQEQNAFLYKSEVIELLDHYTYPDSGE